MLYILGGAARSGKSILSRRLVAEKNVPYLSVDAITSLLQKGIPSVGIKHSLPVIQKAEKLWPILKPFLIHIVEEEPNYLVEGDALLPKFVTQLTKKYKGEIRSCFVGYTNITPDKKLVEIRKYGGEKDDWTRNYSDKFLLSDLKKIINFSKYLESECKKYDIKYFDISTNFQKKLDRVFNYLTSV